MSRILGSAPLPSPGATWSRHRSSWVILSLGVYVLTHWLWLLSGPPPTAATTLIANLVLLPPGFTAAALAWRAGTQRGGAARPQRAWRLISLAFFAISLGNLLWLVIESGLGLQPFPSWADALYLAYYPLLIAGVLFLGEPTWRRPVGFWLDSTIIVAGGGMVVWYFILSPTVRLGTSTWLEGSLLLAYPVGSLAILFAIATVALDRRRVLNAGLAALLLAALACTLVGDVIYGALSVAGVYTSGHWVDGLWGISYALMALAAQRAATQAQQGAAATPQRAAMSPLPYLSAAAGYGLLIAVAVANWGEPLADLAVGATTLATLGAVRLFLTRRENLRLLAERAERAAEARFQALVQHAADVILVLDPTGAHRYASPSAEAVVGYAPEALPPLLTLVDPEQRGEVEQQLAAVLGAPDALATSEARLRHADGSWRTCVITWRNLCHDPHVGGVVAVCHNITARAEAEAALRTSEASLHAIIATASVGISTTALTPGLPYQTVNPALCAMLGYSAEELCQKSVREVTHPDDYERELAVAQVLLEGASSYTLEKRYLRKDGRIVWATVTGSVIRDGHGQPVVGLGVALDTTARHVAEEELRHTQALLQSLVDHAPLHICLRDAAEGRYLVANQLYASWLGLTSRDLVGRRYVDVVPPEIAARMHAEDRQIQATGRPLQSEEIVSDDGSQRALLLTKFPIFADDAVETIGTIGKDITARRRAEQALRESQAFLQASLDALSAHIAILDADGTILTVNAAWRAFGAANGGGDEIGSNYLQVCNGATGPEAPQAAAAAAGIMAVRDGLEPSFTLEYPCQSPAEPCWFILKVTRFRWQDTVRLVVAHENITARKLAEQALQASEARLRALVQHIPGAAVLLFDHDLRYLVADGLGLVPLGLSREIMEGRTLLEVVPAEVVAVLEPLYRATVAGAPPPELDVPAMGRIFRMRFVALRGGDGAVTVGMLLAMDITQLRHDEEQRLALQQRLQEAQRMESIGTLAGGIAHDFNNLLQAVLGHAELLRMDLPPGSPSLPSVQAICKGAERAAELTGQLLSYAGKGHILLRPVGLNTLVGECTQLARTTLHPRAQVRAQLARGLPQVEGDSGQLRQAVLNLLLNASEALSEEGGAIEVETGVEVLDEAAVGGMLLGEELPAGPYVRLSVRDTGHGMDAATQARIFEPFFTTRFTGRGLGLAAVHGIVRGHRGALQVASAPGQGTTISIWLPALAGAPPAPRPQPAPAPVTSGTVLIIDDEAAVRAVTRRTLERLGYAVREAAGGPEGLALLAKGIPDLAVVLLDLTMPQMGGDAVACAIARDHPGTRVLLISGYSAEEISKRHHDLPIAGVLQKPFGIAALRAALAPEGLQGGR